MIFGSLELRHGMKRQSYLTWISHWNGIRIHIAKIPSNRRKWDESNRTEGPNNYRIEDSRFFMRSPSKVSYRCRPKLRSWHDGFDCQGLIKLAEMSFMCSRWGNWNPTAREANTSSNQLHDKSSTKQRFLWSETLLASRLVITEGKFSVLRLNQGVG